MAWSIELRMAAEKLTEMEVGDIFMVVQRKLPTLHGEIEVYMIGARHWAELCTKRCISRRYRSRHERFGVATGIPTRSDR